LRQLNEAADRLSNTHPEAVETIIEKREEINREWQQITTKAVARKERLLDSYDLHRFLSDYRDLSNWIHSMMALVSSEELADDVTGAEALLERHQVSSTFQLKFSVSRDGFYMGQGSLSDLVI
jgi:spectrin alpha